MPPAGLISRHFGRSSSISSGAETLVCDVGPAAMLPLSALKKSIKLGTVTTLTSSGQHDDTQAERVNP
jgi:hypothetical protein